MPRFKFPFFCLIFLAAQSALADGILLGTWRSTESIPGTDTFLELVIRPESFRVCSTALSEDGTWRPISDGCSLAWFVRGEQIMFGTNPTTATPNTYWQRGDRLEMPKGFLVPVNGQWVSGPTHFERIAHFNGLLPADGLNLFPGFWPFTGMGAATVTSLGMSVLYSSVFAPSGELSPASMTLYWLAQPLIWAGVAGASALAVRLMESARNRHIGPMAGFTIGSLGTTALVPCFQSILAMAAFGAG